MDDCRKIYLDLFNKYYPHVPAYERYARAIRCADHAKLVVDRVSARSAKICDIGGLFGDFASGCAALGMDATFVDDFLDPCHADRSDPRFRIHEEFGAKAIKRDVMAHGIDFADETFDAITCFETMEHWHRSPKPLFAQVMRALKPNGLFILSAPNCCDVWKRITVPLGRASWSPMPAWYDAAIFRSHVREPNVEDLRYIARDMKLRGVSVFGRNWSIYLSRHAAVRQCAPWVDRLLRCRPSLCLSIYILGRK